MRGDEVLDIIFTSNSVGEPEAENSDSGHSHIPAWTGSTTTISSLSQCSKWKILRNGTIAKNIGTFNGQIAVYLI